MNNTEEVKQIKKQVQMEAWRNEIREQQTSGLPVREWCEQKGVSASGYYYRLQKVREGICRQIREKDTSGAENSAIVPIRKTSMNTATGLSVIEIEKDGLHVKMPCNCSPELISVMLREMKA